MQKEFGNDPQFYNILQKELRKDKRRDDYIRMLNDSIVMSSANTSTLGRKGAGAFKRFQGRLKMLINNIDEPKQIEKTTVWDGLRKKKRG